MKNEFIAYDKKNKRFIHFYRVAVNGLGDVYTLGEDASKGYVRKVSNIEILEYSGKKDRNGTKLYKGDIVKAELDEYTNTARYHEDLPEKTIIGVVVIRPSEGAKLLVKKIIPKDAPGIAIGRTMRIDQSHDLRIGNIYTKPELLEEEE
jgi:uncharacterized phage protein (TIGR01671 family)